MYYSGGGAQGAGTSESGSSEKNVNEVKLVQKLLKTHSKECSATLLAGISSAEDSEGGLPSGNDSTLWDLLLQLAQILDQHKSHLDLQVRLNLCSIVVIFPIDCCIIKLWFSFTILMVTQHHLTNNNPSLFFLNQ